MQQLETNLNFISSLPDLPAMTTSALKAEFDKAGNIIKDFINSTLEAEITSDIATSLATGKAYTDSAIGALSFTASNISYDGTASGLEATNVQDATDEVKEVLEGELETLEGRIETLEGNMSQSAISISGATGTTISKQSCFAFGNMAFVQFFCTTSIANGTSKVICTLPEALRPTATRYIQGFATDSGYNYGLSPDVEIATNGEVKVTNPNRRWNNGNTKIARTRILFIKLERR